MRKNLTKKLFLSILTLAFAVISLGASTYAWFVLSEDANVEAFSGTVQSGTSGLEIAVTAYDATTVEESAWKATSLDITADLAEIFEDFKFDAVQNADPLNLATFSDINGNTVTPNGVNGKYLTFKLWFRLADTNASTEAEQVYLNEYTMETTAGVDTWFVNKEYTKIGGEKQLQGTSATYYVSDAARITFTDCANELYLETPELLGGTGYESEGKQPEGALSYFNAIEDESGRKTCPSDEDYADPAYGESDPYDGTTAIVDLPVDTFMGSTVVTIWIDGWDGECINAIFGQTLSVSFKFSLNPEE